MQPFLSNLGVPVLDQARPPTVKGFPLGLNVNNVAEWTTAVHALIPSDNAAKDWGTTLRLYVDLCEKVGVFPFSNVSHNDQIVDILWQARKDFIRFVNQNNFFHNVTVRSTFRNVMATDTGFVLNVYAKARIEDPSFIKWLQGLRTRYTEPRPQIKSLTLKYTKPIAPNLSVFVHNETVTFPERWLVGYEISVPFFPDIPNNKLPSKAEIEEFVLTILWMPLLRAMRPIGMAHRLI